jgi:hypothetical protein
VQPQTWLCAHWDDTLTCTGSLLHLHFSVPPEKLSAAGFMPWSTLGCIVMLMNIPRLAMNSNSLMGVLPVIDRRVRRFAIHTTPLVDQVKYDVSRVLSLLAPGEASAGRRRGER